MGSNQLISLLRSMLFLSLSLSLSTALEGWVDHPNVFQFLPDGSGAPVLWYTTVSAYFHFPLSPDCIIVLASSLLLYSLIPHTLLPVARVGLIWFQFDQCYKNCLSTPGCTQFSFTNSTMWQQRTGCALAPNLNSSACKGPSRIEIDTSASAFSWKSYFMCVCAYIRVRACMCGDVCSHSCFALTSCGI